MCVNEGCMMHRSLSTNDLSSDSKRIDHEIKQVHKQIALAEKTFANLIKDFTNITVDMTRLQTRECELGLTLSSMAKEESQSLRNSLDAIGTQLNDMNGLLSLHINTIQMKVIQAISECISKCKVTRENLEQCSSAKKRRANAMKNLEKNTKSNRKMTEEMSKTHRTVLETTKQINDLEDEMMLFERSKAENLRKWMKLYLHSSLAFHVKAVEHYTKAYQAISLIDVEEHVEHFNAILFPPQQNKRVDFVRWNSFNSLSNDKHGSK